MKNAMQKDFWREIQHTRSRFFSIMILVALSVAFLSGLKATAPDMKRTGDFPKTSDREAILNYLDAKFACDQAVAVFKRCYARIEAAYAAIRSIAVTSFGIAHVQASRR